MAEMVANINNKNYYLTVSTFMMTILSHFNAADCLSFKDIQFATNITELHLKQALYSLCCSGPSASALLVKVPNSKVINEEDTFSLNPLFSAKTARVKIPNRQYNP